MTREAARREGLTEAVNLRVTPAERSLLDAMAELEGVTLSHWCRTMLTHAARERFKQHLQKMVHGEAEPTEVEVPNEALTTR